MLKYCVPMGDYPHRVGYGVPPALRVALFTLSLEAECPNSFENYWAVLTLKANGKGILREAFIELSTSVKIGDPIAVIGSDRENIPYGKEHVSIEITEHKRQGSPGRHEST